MSLTHFRCYQIYYTVLLHNVTYIIPLSYKFALNFVLSVDRLKECWLSHCFLAWSVFVSYAINPRTYTQFHTPTVVQRVGGAGGEGIGTPHQSFWNVAVFRNDFAFSGKPLIFSTRWGIFYGRWRYWRPFTSPTMVATLAAILDFTKNKKPG